MNLDLLGFWTLSIVQQSNKLSNTAIRKLDLFPSSDEGGDTYCVGSLIQIFLFTIASRPALRLPQPPIQRVPRVKRPRRDADHSLSSSAKKGGSVPPLPHMSASCVVLLIKRKDKFTFTFISLWLYTPCGPWPLFQFINLYTVGRTPWTGISPSQGRYLDRTAQTQDKRTQTPMPQLGFEPTIPVFWRAKKVPLPLF
jgi:hypothetical protein